MWLFDSEAFYKKVSIVSLRKKLYLLGKFNVFGENISQIVFEIK